MTNANGVAYLTVPGEDETVLTFKVAVGDQIADAPTVVNFQADGVYGTPKNPLLVDIDEATSIHGPASDNEKESVYDLSGRLVNSSTRQLFNSQKKGVFIVNGKKIVVK